MKTFELINKDAFEGDLLRPYTEHLIEVARESLQHAIRSVADEIASHNENLPDHVHLLGELVKALHLIPLG